MNETAEIHQRELPEGWEEYVLNHSNGTWYHGNGWKRFVERTFGHQSYYLSTRRDGHIVGIMPLNLVESPLFGKILISSAYARYAGVCCNDAAAESSLLSKAKAIARDLKVDYLEIRNVKPLNDPELLTRTFKQGFWLALPDSFEELWKSFRSEIRNRARKAESAGCVSHVRDVEAVDDFYGIFCRRMRELGTPAYGRNFFRNLMDIYEGDARLVVTKRDGRVVGAGIMLFYGETVEVPWICSLGREFKAYPNNSLYVAAMRYAIDRKMKRFDFGCSTKGSGNATFKQRWGANTVQLNWCYLPVKKQSVPDLTPNNAKYSFAIQTWKKLPLWVTNAVGPVLMRMIP